MIKTSDISKIIKESLKIKDEVLEEAFVASEKTFSLKTEFLSEKNKLNHIELYKDYIANFNRVSAELDAVDKSDVSSNFSKFRSLKLDEVHNMNAVYLHELYFKNISDLNSNISMDSLSYIKLSQSFGSFDNWQKDFIACCLGSRCGWAVTAYNTYLKNYHNIMIDLHTGHIPIGSIPVIVMDVWQHAYYSDYLKDSKTYTYAMMKQLNWEIIEKRVEKIEKMKRLSEV